MAQACYETSKFTLSVFQNLLRSAFNVIIPIFPIRGNGGSNNPISLEETNRSQALLFRYEKHGQQFFGLQCLSPTYLLAMDYAAVTGAKVSTSRVGSSALNRPRKPRIARCRRRNQQIQRRPSRRLYTVLP